MTENDDQHPSDIERERDRGGEFQEISALLFCPRCGLALPDNTPQCPHCEARQCPGCGDG